MSAARTAISIAVVAWASIGWAGERWGRDDDGLIRVRPLPVPTELPGPTELRNAWAEDWEAAFWQRANHVLRETANGSGRYGTTWFESEKRSYGWAMLSVLGGFEEAGLRFLQAEDAAAERWNRHTLGIDYFPCFTLKQQVRKLFFFGDVLKPAYRERMRAAARLFTERDPLGRPHPAYAGKTGWGPDAKNSWVDVRSTDNLKLMRETSVYLLAEDSGREATRQLYKTRLQQFIATMYHTGMGEWDSENYLGHSIVPLLNLYDFARDLEVRRLAKAGLDWMCAAAAVKYWRGSFGGPTRRDYNHPYPFGGSAASIVWLWFGDSPLLPEHFESDEVHVLTSAYRPPAAVVSLARRQFARPLEMLAAKPSWAAWKTPAAAAPEFYETQYFGERFQLGTLLRGTQAPDVNGFKILTRSESRGADTILAAPVSDPLRIGSPMYQEGLLAAKSAVGQNGNLALWLTAESEQPFLWLVPRSARVEAREGVTFLRCESTTCAIWPLNLSKPSVDAELTQRVRVQTKKGQELPRWPHSTVLSARRSGPGVYGFAIEVDEGDPDEFVERATKLRPETSELALRGATAMTGVGGRRVRLQWGDSIADIKVWRDGKRRDLEAAANRASYHALGEHRLIEQAWQGTGTLSVDAGGHSFRCTVSREGEVRFASGEK